MKQSIYLPGLNGLRAIAALSVVIAHVSLSGIADFGLPSSFELPLAGFGVTLFFVISGFLITYLLIQEQEQHSVVSIRKFYVRRIFRIWPIYYLYIIVAFGVLFFLGKAGEMHVPQIWFYLFFAANIPFVFQQGILILVHYWSIGVEEQFYLWWPWIVHFTKNRLLLFSIIFFTVFFLAKIIIWRFLGSQSYEYRLLSVTRFHCMMIGAIGAILYFRENAHFINVFSSKIVQYVSWILFLLLGLNIIHIFPVIAHEVIAMASLSMIIGQITIKTRIVNLENKSCDFIGKISYGIYVVHPLVIFILSILFHKIQIGLGLKCVLVYSTVIILTILIAWLSYMFYEKPFLKLKRKFAVVESVSSMSDRQV